MSENRNTAERDDTTPEPPETVIPDEFWSGLIAKHLAECLYFYRSLSEESRCGIRDDLLYAWQGLNLDEAQKRRGDEAQRRRAGNRGMPPRCAGSFE